MKMVFLAIAAVVLTQNAFAGVSTAELTKALQNPKIQAALKDRNILSMKVVYDQQGEAGFDFDMFICSHDTVNEYTTTTIPGALVLYGNGEVSQNTSDTPNPNCK
jgi:hypothetical protein